MEERDRKFDACAAVLERLSGLAVSAAMQRRVDLLRADLMIRQAQFGDALNLLERLDSPETGGTCSGFGRARTLDRLGRHDEAFTVCVETKRRYTKVTGHTYDAQGAQNCAKDAREFFTSANMRLLPRADRRADIAQPLFVCGFLRSGTTLMKQSLGCHSAISQGGVLVHIEDLAQHSQGLLGTPMAYPNSLAELWMAEHRTDANLLRDFYLNRIENDGLAEPGTRWVLDKCSDNEWCLGLMSIVFPRSPIVRMVRHPLDVLVSVMLHPMDYGFRWGGSLEDAATHYALTADLADDMLGRFEHRCLSVKCEDLVDRQEETMRRVLKHIGEPFDARCLAPHTNKRYNPNVSHVQVSEPLYTRSWSRYVPYLDYLRPVIPIVAPVMERWGYEV